VIAVGRVLPEIGEDLLSSGGADFIAMGRQLLADPDLVNKLRSGSPETVRPCINCYVCVEQNFWDGVPVCAVNPALGDEQAAEFRPASRPQHVVVVGGGPAGMESARVARTRGHRVTLLESSDRLGGSAWFSQLTTPSNGPFLDWQQQELERLGVTVERRHRATVDSIVGLRPDSVILATGAQRGVPDVPGAHLPHVHTGDTLRALITGEADATRTGGVLRLLGAAGRLTADTVG
jgi:NADPH-dependent 2,4-dienoyl-CoA reductase/sulfur reductase-like enzyme